MTGRGYAAGLALSVLAAAVTGADMAGAQETGMPEGDLRARQAALYETLLAEPDNLDVMFEHALTSVELRDFEAAITTLERMLIYNPALSRAKVELGAAYFRLGAYENARYYFQDVLDNDAPPPEVARRINVFIDEIGKRTQKSGFSGIASVGIAYSSNANLGPPNDGVLFFDTDFTLNPDFVEADDFGVRAIAQGRHYYDLNRPNDDVWLSDFQIFSVNYLDEQAGDIDSFSFQSGPRLALSPRSYGPTIRPYFSGELLTSGNDLLYYGAGVGADYSDTLSDDINIFAAFETKWREYDERNDFDGLSVNAAFGAAYSPDSHTTFSALIVGDTDQTSADFNTNYELGLRVAAVRRYDSGFDFTDRLWSISGFAAITGRWYDEPDPVISATRTREDVDLRAGISHLFHLTGGWFVQADADYLYRDSNLPNFDFQNIGVALSVGLSF